MSKSDRINIRVVKCIRKLAWLSLCAIFLASCKSSPISKYNYEAVEIGMTLMQVEAILGPGQQIPAKNLPTTTGMTPVVHGEQYFEWQDKDADREIIVAFSRGKVCDKWYWEPSL